MTGVHVAVTNAPVTLCDVGVTGCGEDGVAIESRAGRVVLDALRIGGCGRGVRVALPSGAESARGADVSLVNCLVHGCLGDGFQANVARTVRLAHCIFENNAGRGARLTSVAQAAITGCRFEGNAATDVDISPEPGPPPRVDVPAQVDLALDCLLATLEGNYFGGNNVAAVGLRIGPGSNASIIGNVLTGHRLAIWITQQAGQVVIVSIDGRTAAEAGGTLPVRDDRP